MIYDVVKTVVLFYAEILWWVVRPFYELFEWIARKLLKIRTVEEHRSEMRLLNEVLRDKYREIHTLRRQVAALELKAQPFEKAVVPFKEDIARLEKELAAKDERVKSLEREVEGCRSELSDTGEEAERLLGLYRDGNRHMESAEEKIMDLEHQRESARERVEELSAELEAEKQRGRALAAESERAREQSRKLEAELKEKDSVFEKLEREISVLQEETRLLEKMSPEEKDVYCYMLGLVKSTVNEIREETGLSDRQVRYALKKLIKKKLAVEVEKGSSRRPSYYGSLDM